MNWRHVAAIAFLALAFIGWLMPPEDVGRVVVLAFTVACAVPFLVLAWAVVDHTIARVSHIRALWVIVVILCILAAGQSTPLTR
jgi:uncharacterized membrane-anchored protein